MLYSLSILSSLCMKLTMDMSVIGGSLPRMKSNFTFVMLVCLKSKINLKVNKGINRFKTGSNWYPQRIMGIVVVKSIYC